MRIADIYAGKPDASDEIRERGYDEFAKNYITPSEVNVNALASTVYGTPFFIMGDKGTGKTALIHYLEHYVCQIDGSACSSFISFEKSFTPPRKAEFNAISSYITIDQSLATKGENVESDFTYIWKWQLYQRIIDDNSNFSEGLFVMDSNWDSFVSLIDRIEKTIHKNKMVIPASVSFTAMTNPQLGTITPGIRVEPVDLSQRNFSAAKGYGEFVKIIDEADSILKDVIRTDIPYYLFIDELEAYRGSGDTFFRDLRMIRDLLFVVKKMNDLFRSGTKIICSVRLEILNAINRFIESKQLHKIMQGYDERLVWEHTNTNSFKHPIIGILLRRIESAEEQNGEKTTTDDIIKKWFETNVYNKHICTYILDNTWHKPRDIVRLLLSAQTKNSRNASRFNQNVFDTFMPIYSKQCLDEIKEEMRALYTAIEIDQIINCLRGYKSCFKYTEIIERARSLYPESRLSDNPYTVLDDLYRIGVIGNIIEGKVTPQWAHKGQYTLMIDEPWQMLIHPALCFELSVSVRIDRRRDQRKNMPNVYNAVVKNIRYKYLLVSFEKDGIIEEGYISINNLGIIGINPGEIDAYFLKGDEVRIVVRDYNPIYSNWFARVI